MSMLSIKNLDVRLRNGQPVLRRVNIELAAGEVRGLIGESGAGKSMIGKAILDILPQALHLTGGSIHLDGTDLTALPPRERRAWVARNVALIPQDPLTALNPSRRIGPQITDRLTSILGWAKADAVARAIDLLNEVAIPDPARVMRLYPHELSGGMRQRILIASAFVAEPKLIIADEPTTALDVTVQKKIIRLIRQMQEQHGTALLFVTHDLGVVSKVCSVLTVLYAGHVVEDTDVHQFFAGPKHPYARALLAATPRHDDPAGALMPVPEQVIAAVQAEVAAADREFFE